MENTDEPDPVSQRIKSIRLKKGISQKDFAETLNIQRSQYNRMESRATKMTLEMLTRIASALGVTVIHLLTDSSAPHSSGSFRVTFSEPVPLDLMLNRSTSLYPDDSILAYRKQLFDKEEIITGFQNSRQILVRQVELGLLRTASTIKLEIVSDSDSGRAHMKSYLGFDIPPLHDFPYAAEQQPLLDRVYSGFQFMFLIAYINLTEGNFSNLVTRCIESYIIPHNTLYARAFLHLRNAKETIVGRHGSDLLHHRWMMQDQQERTDIVSPSAPKNSSGSDET